MAGMLSGRPGVGGIRKSWQAIGVMGSLLLSACHPVLNGVQGVAADRPQFELTGASCRVGIYYDANRLKEEQVRAWMKFNMSRMRPAYLDLMMLVPLALPGNSTEYERQLQAEEDGIKQFEADVSKWPLPVGAEDMAAKVRDLLTADLAVNRALLDFCKGGDVSILIKAEARAAVGQSCLGALTLSESQEARCKAATFKWANCVLAQASARVGPYPVERWTASLAAAGVTMRRLDCEGE